MQIPLIIFDTNVLMDVLLKRDGDQAVLLVNLAEQRKAELVVPEYVLIEFRGTAMRWIRDARARLTDMGTTFNEWVRCGVFDRSAQDLRDGASDLEKNLADVSTRISEVIGRIERVARIPKHEPDVHFRGDLRYLSGRPPDKPVAGLKDCRIFESVLSIAGADQSVQRERFFVSRDSDFNHHELRNELAPLGVTIRGDIGKLFGELRASA